MRNAVVSDWLSRSEWASWDRHAMTGDASARRYERLIGPNETSVILMDAPPETCGSQAQFVLIAAHLRRLNLAAPDVLAWDDSLGLMVLNDLGRGDFASHLSTSPSDEAQLYTAAVDTLLTLQSSPPPVGLTHMTPNVGARMIDIAFEWAATDDSASLASDITARIQTLLQSIEADPNTLSLRDFHAENLIWRPEQPRNLRVGLLDFQDAFVTHPAYDLASLLRDARRDVDPALVNPLIKKMAGKDAAFRTAFHVMAVQRNLRILGIFNRLAQQDGKSGYLAFVPRVWNHLMTDLAAPELGDLGPLVLRAFTPIKIAK